MVRISPLGKNEEKVTKFDEKVKATKKTRYKDEWVEENELLRLIQNNKENEKALLQKKKDNIK